MIATAEQAVERLEELVRLFDHARDYAANDALALGEIFNQADDVLIELRASGIEQSSKPGRDAVIEAARRARHSHAALESVIGIEVARVRHELTRLSSGSSATTIYGAPARTAETATFDRSY